MPIAAPCGSSLRAGGWNSLHGMLVAELGILHVTGMTVRESERQPLLRRMIQLVGRNVVAEQSRPLSVNHSSRVCGCQSKPTVLRTPLANISVPVPSGFIREDRRETRIVGPLADVARSADRHIEQAVRSEANELLAVVGFGRQILVHDHRRGRISSFDSMLSYRVMRLIPPTYSEPSRKATPFGSLRPLQS